MSICHLCLRTDRKVQIVDEKLGDLLDDLCEFATEELTECCAECTRILKKFYDFKEKWILAVNILKKWKKQKYDKKTPMNLLYTKLPQSGLGFSNIQNCKVFICKEAELVTAPPINVTPSIPCVAINPSKLGTISNNSQTNTVLFGYETDDLKNKFLEYHHRDDTKCESVKSEDSETIQISKEFDMVVEDCDNEAKDDDELTDDAEYLDEELLNDAEYLDNSLLKDDNVTIKRDCDSYEDDNTGPIQPLNAFEEVFIEENYKDIQTENDTKMNSTKAVNQTKNMASPEHELKKIHSEIIQKIYILKYEKKLVCPMHQSKIEFLRDMLKQKFDKNSELKDEKGNVIDKKVILDCLDKLSLKLLKQITTCLLGSRTFDPADINLFSRLQNRYKSEYESVFTCEELLTDKQILKEFNKRQFHKSYVESMYKCTICYRGFKYEKLLDYHLRTFHDESAPFECSLCKMRFRSKVAISKHKKHHKMVLKCKLCPFDTCYWNSMIKHFNYHKGITYNCETCSKTFKSMKALNMHRLKLPSAVICGSCAMGFASPTGLTFHRRLKHKDEVTDPADSVKCQICDVTFVSKEVLEVHMRRSYACSTGRSTRRAIGCATKPFVCRLCQSAGPHVGWLNRHFRFEHPNISIEEAYWMGKKYLCHVCGKTFYNVTKLDEHKAFHTGAKPYSCPQCHRGYRSTKALKCHLVVHLPKTRQCEICGKKFRSLSYLDKHRKIHLNECYKCENCPAKFLSINGLMEHMLGFHQNIRRVRVKPGKRKKPLEAEQVNTETEDIVYAEE